MRRRRVLGRTIRWATVEVQLPDSIAKDPIAVARLQACTMAEMMAKLPDAIHAPGTSMLLAQAGIQSFFVNARTLIEFLEIKPSSHHNDLSASDTLPAGTKWMPTTDAALKSRLKAHWVIASQRMVHFTKMRVPDGTGKFVRVETGLPDLKAIADDVLTV
jgi:hypothetical protein